MKYRVNEIFQSLKGEGVHLGTPVNFIRMAKCNIACDHCDTTFNNPVVEMEVHEILSKLHTQLPGVVITGGEPTIQDLRDLLVALRESGYHAHLESNGTLPFPVELFDWICISPKLNYMSPLDYNIRAAHEIKMPISDAADIVMAEAFRSGFPEARAVWYLHPWNDDFLQVRHGKELGEGARTAEGWNGRANQLCIEYAKQTGTWKVSIQAHKVWSVR